MNCMVWVRRRWELRRSRGFRLSVNIQPQIMKDVIIFPYINLKKVIKMDDFEIHPFEFYDLSEELSCDEADNLNIFVRSFRETFFKEWQTPKQMTGIWILKYKGTIIRNTDEVESIHDTTKILFLLLKLHVSYDFYNPWMNRIQVKSFDIFGYNVCDDYTNKFSNMWSCEDLYSTVPESIGWLGNISFYPIDFCTNTVPVECKLFSWWGKIFWAQPDSIDLTDLYQWIMKDTEYYQKFLNIASLHFWLEQQNDLFFYYSIIPSIIEVLLQLDSGDKKKKEAIKFWKKLDADIVKNNHHIDTIIYIDKGGTEHKENLGIIARTFVLIYDLRNLLLHEWKKSFEMLKVEIHGVELRIYDIFQLIFKYTILHELIEKRILVNRFTKVEIEWNMLFWQIKIKYSKDCLLTLDQELNWLIQSARNIVSS